MIIIKKGDILKCNENIIVHQVNIEGIMGGGLAKQIACNYPNTEKEYIRHCKSFNNRYEDLKGQILICEENNKYIANCFSQKPNFDTDYESMKEALTKIKEYAKKFNLSIGIPYGIGCGIANGNWNIVLEMLIEVFENYNATLYKL